MVKFCGGRAVYADHLQPGRLFEMTAASYISQCGAKTRAVIVNSPSNPTGKIMSGDELRQVIDFFYKKNILVIIDDCYRKIIYTDGEYPSPMNLVPAAREWIAVVSSLSKTYAMTGWRIGYALGPPQVVAAVARLQSHSTSNPNSVAQKAALEALSGNQDFVGEMLAEYRVRRDSALERLRRIPQIRCHEPQGAFYLYPDISAVLGRRHIHGSAQFAEQLLEEAEVAVVPGEAFGTRGHIRITFAVSMRELERGIDRLSRFLLGLLE
jgi:aspartate aminotransferase